MALLVTYAQPNRQRAVPMRAIGADPTLLDIEAVVLGHYHISVNELLGPSRKAKYIEPRQVAYWLAASMTGHSLSVIGRSFRRDHTSILYGRDEVAKRAATDLSFATKLCEFILQVREEAQIISSIRWSEVGHSSQSAQQGNHCPEQDNGSNQHKDERVNEAHEGFGHELGDDGPESGLPDPVDEACDQQRDNQLNDEVHHGNLPLGCDRVETTTS